MISLLDSVDSYLVDAWLAFYDIRSERRGWIWKRVHSWMKPGFRHVEVWREDRGAWARVDPCLEFMVAEVHLQPPWEMGFLPGATYVHVVRLAQRGIVREPLFFGPVTCVELTKAMIGIRAPWVRTPYGLYKHLRKTECPSFSVSAWLRAWLWRFRERLRTCGASMTSFGASNEVAEQAEGSAGSQSTARTPGAGSRETGRAGESEDQAHVERFPRIPYVRGLGALASRAE